MESENEAEEATRKRRAEVKHRRVTSKIEKQGYWRSEINSGKYRKKKGSRNCRNFNRKQRQSQIYLLN